MRRKYDIGYLELLESVKAKMPKYYGVLLAAKYPHMAHGRVYNVINAGTQDWDVLRALADVLGVETKEALK